MANSKSLHAEEVATDAALAHRLLVTQFPHWSTLPIARVRADSTDNAMYRLGADLAIRLPRRASAVAPIDKEHLWLPQLAARLPLSVPVPLAKGEPGEGYPWPWSVVRWLEGSTPAPDFTVDQHQLAHGLSQFIHALSAIDAREGPCPGPHNFWRGVPLATRDANMRERFHWLADLDDIDAITAAWDADLAVPEWSGSPVWIHGDLQRGNLLVSDGKLSGVIDWSAAGVGDPACDLSGAWSLFDRPARETFRKAMAVDDETWRRGRAWGLLEGVLALSYYTDKTPSIAAAGRHTIDMVLADHYDG